MPVCPRCHDEYASPADRCVRCDVPLLEVIRRRADVEPPPAPEPRAVEGAHPDDHGTDDVESGDDPLKLLLEEPIPEIAEMLGEFLRECGIRAVVHTDTIGRLYRLPVPLSQARILVPASDFAEARELIQRFSRPD